MRGHPSSFIFFDTCSTTSLATSCSWIRGPSNPLSYLIRVPVQVWQRLVCLFLFLFLFFCFVFLFFFGFFIFCFVFFLFFCFLFFFFWFKWKSVWRGVAPSIHFHYWPESINAAPRSPYRHLTRWLSPPPPLFFLFVSIRVDSAKFALI